MSRPTASPKAPPNPPGGGALGSIFGAGGRRPAAPVPAPLPAPGVAALLAVVDRLEAVLDAETDALKRSLPADVAEIGNRKRQGLLEMERALRAAAADGTLPGVPELRERLRRFSGAVERNRAALGAQLRAVREVADIVAQTMREAESDGTYSPFASSINAAAAGRA